MTTDVTERTFDNEIADFTGDTLVDFWAVWCGPCRMLTPTLEKIESENSNLRVLKVNVDENPGLASRFQVMSIPTMILFKEDGSTKTIIGVKPKAQLEKELGLTF